ncbi:MAG: hypothetical protein KatS3mg114_1448 [Planctomycetaceae bacterium]|nr:MAG: hypothetical protein KatS3mg114_1448 [Planctomycetaceae bacterium]
MMVRMTIAWLSAWWWLQGEMYTERYRPQVHFTPAKNWTNDPNGLVYHAGEYHLFYQYNPHGDQWGHMSWGHAVSRDLVHWEHLPVALPEREGIMIFSGSAVVDEQNTSGFGTGGVAPLVAIYTGHRSGRQDQRLAYSLDRGRSWIDYAGNPVLDRQLADFRDPKVFWHADTNRWVMVVALSTQQQIHLYTSTNLKEWTYSRAFGPAGMADGLWECPDLFPLTPPEGGKPLWILMVNVNPGGPAGGSGCQYFVGEFDGREFRELPGQRGRAAEVPTGTVLADFEEGYGGWIATGTAFGKEPASGTLPQQQPVRGYLGQRLVNTYLGGDAATGTLTSPAFAITADYLNFLIGGGHHPETRMELLVQGEVVRRASGENREQLRWQSWDVRAWRGKSAQLRIVDEHQGSWGHINIDQIMLSDRPAHSADDRPLWLDYGADNYAAVTWNNIPAADGRRILLGWMSNWEYAGAVPTHPWRGAMTLPRELSLKASEAGWRIRQQPVRELTSLRQQAEVFEGGTLAAADAWLRARPLSPHAVPVELRLTLGPSRARQQLVLFQGPDTQTTVVVDRPQRQWMVDRTRSQHHPLHPQFPKRQVAPLPDAEGPVTLHLIIDRCSLEVFAQEGETVITSLVFPEEDAQGLSLQGDSQAPVQRIERWLLRSIWQQPR